MKIHKLSSGAVKVTISLLVQYLGQIYCEDNPCKLSKRVTNYMFFSYLKRQQCLFSVCVAAFLRHQTCFRLFPHRVHLGDCSSLFDLFWGMHGVSWLRDKAIKGYKLKDLAKCFQKGLLFAPHFFLFRAMKTSLSAMAQLFRLPFRPMLSILSLLSNQALTFTMKTPSSFWS